MEHRPENIDLPADQQQVAIELDNDHEPHCPICLGKFQIRQTCYQIHKCKGSTLCETCLDEFNKQQIKICPICRIELDVTTTKKITVSLDGLNLIAIIGIIILRILIEVPLTVLLLKKYEKDFATDNSYLSLVISCNLILNYGAIVLLVGVFQHLTKFSCRDWAKLMVPFLFYHAIILVVMTNVDYMQDNPFKKYLYYFIIPLYGGLYISSVIIGLWKCLTNCRSYCFDLCCETKLTKFRINPVEMREYEV